jgi:hypothetical protein
MAEQRRDDGSGDSDGLSLAAVLADRQLSVTHDVTVRLNAAWRRWLPALSSQSSEVAWLPVVIVASLPLLLDVCLRLADDGSSWRGLVWMGMSAAFLSLLLLTPLWAVEWVRRLVVPVDAMLRTDAANAPSEAMSYSPEAMQFLVKTRQRLHLGRSHYALCLMGALGAFAGNLYASRQLPHGTLGPVFNVYAGAIGFVAVDSFRWMLRFPSILIQPLTSFTRLRVVMHSPVTTPGIRAMARFAADAAARANVGLFLVGLGLLWEVFSGAPHHGAGVSRVERLALVDLGPLALTAVVVVYVTFVPQHWLSQVADRQRDRILDELLDELPPSGAVTLLSDEPQKVMDLYDRIAAASTETAEVRVLVRRLLGAVVVLLPQLIAVGAKVLHVG